MHRGLIIVCFVCMPLHLIIGAPLLTSLDIPLYSSGQTSGDLRLVARNGQTSRYLTAGRLEVYYNGQWGTVCANYFRALEAVTACNQLGFPDGYLHYTSVDSGISGFSTR
jgi:hypothetical protein